MPDPLPTSHSSQPSPESSGVPIPMPRLLAMAIGVRIFNDTGIQIFAPFLTAISSGLGVSIITLGALNSVRSLMGLMAPVSGSVADTIGYRPTMRALLLLGAAGMFVFALSQTLWLAVVGMIIMGIGIFSFAPVLQAYISAQIPYERRSRGLGIVEYGWAVAGIVGLSVSGLLIDRFSWRAPFLVLGAGLIVAFFVFGALPATPGSHSRAQARASFLQWQQWPTRLFALLHLESNARSAWTAILVNGLNVFGASTISMVYGVWLAREYGLTTTRLGLVALVLGLSEFAGSILVSLIGDRLGKYRSILGSSICAVVAYLLLPLLNFRVLAIVAGLIFARFLFEVSIVSSISLLSEQVPTQRGKVLTLASAMVTSGVAAASIIGPFSYSTWGIVGPGLISASASLLATILTLGWVSEKTVR